MLQGTDCKNNCPIADCDWFGENIFASLTAAAATAAAAAAAADGAWMVLPPMLLLLLLMRLHLVSVLVYCT
jgi:hypothetical protein